MQVDAYQYCPCGSGKKIKFCKCADNFKDLDKIDRMISGGQLVAALDRINQLLQTSPSAAWLLSLKAQILYQLQEFDSLAETANRFWKLKPDNQLALWLMTVSETVREPSVMNAAKFFLDGVSEVRDVIHPFGKTAGMMLIQRLVMEEKQLSALLLTELLSTLFKSSEPSEMFHQMTREVDTSTYLRIHPYLYDKTGNVSWNERLQEVRSLLRSHRIPQAYLKLQSLNREFSDQPVLLSMLITCELYRCDSAAAARYAERLAKNENLPRHERAYFQALAFALAPVASGASFTQEGLLFDLTEEKEEQINRLVNQSSQFEQWQMASDEIRLEIAQFIGEEIPPKSVYHFFSPYKIQVDGEPAEVECSAAILAIFGKQTDHPARLLVQYTKDSHRTSHLIDEMLKTLSLNEADSKFPAGEAQSISISYLMVPFIRHSAATKHSTEQERNVLRLRLKGVVHERIKQASLPCLDGKSVVETIGSAQYQIKLLGILLYFLSQEERTFAIQDFDQLVAEFQIDPLPRIETGEELNNISPAELHFIDIAKIPAKVIIPFASYVYSMRLSSLYPALIKRLQQSDVPNDPPGLVPELLLMMQFSITDNLRDRLSKLEEIIALHAEAKKPVGQMVIMGANLLFANGESSEADAWLQKYYKKYPDDPVLLAFLQQLIAQIPPTAQPLSPTLPAGPGQDSAGGLWIPGETSDPSPASSSGGKLWLPGME